MTTDLTAAFRQVFGAPPTWTYPRDASDLDEQTLRRSRLSMAAARAQRRWSERPFEPWCDSLATRAERAWGGEA